LTLYTSESVCDSTSSVKKGTTRHYFGKSVSKTTIARADTPGPRAVLPISVAALFGGLFIFATRRRRSALQGWFACLLLLGVAGTAIGCGSSGTSTSSASVSTDVSTGNLRIDCRRRRHVELKDHCGNNIHGNRGLMLQFVLVR
jgi:hypothetical protein